jgi:hypothetical protein
MLSLTRGKPIAIIKKGKYHNQILHLLVDEKKCCETCTGECVVPCCKTCCAAPDIQASLDDVISEDEIRSFKKKLSMADINLLRKAIVKHKPPENEELRAIYNKLAVIYNNKSKREFKIYDEGTIQPLPDFEKSERVYVAGATGSGKSTYVGRFLQQLKKVYPQRDIFLFSDVSEDPVLDVLRPNRIKLDNSFLDMDITPKTLENSIVVFDDIDSIENKKIKEKVGGLRDSLLKRGRHENISTICTNHLLTDYKHTRIVLNEVNSITMFPRSGSSHAIKYTMKHYCGLSTKQIDKIFEVPSRWVSIHKHFPVYMMHEKGIELL